MTLNERLREAFDKRVCGTAMLPASDLLSAMTAIEQAEAENAALKEQVAQLIELNNNLISHRTEQYETITQQADVIEQIREAFRVASMDTETINRKAPEIAKGCCSMPMPDTEGTYHLANEEVCNVVSSYLYWLHKNQPTALQPSPEILQARDKRVAEACAKVCIEQSEGIARSTPVSRDRVHTLVENTMFKGIARPAPVRDCSESSVRESAFRIRNGAWERHL